jgi:hypothetical protein
MCRVAPSWSETPHDQFIDAAAVDADRDIFRYSMMHDHRVSVNLIRHVR